MKKVFLALACLLGFVCTIFAGGNDIEGSWYSGSKDARIKIFKNGDKYFGIIDWLKNPKDENGLAKTDIHNPVEKERKKSLLGLLLLKNFEYKNGEWTNGSIYDPKNGKEYSCTIKKAGNTLQVRGYIGISLLGRTETWQKAD